VLLVAAGACQCIGLFMDTSLASLVGLLELVGIARAVIQQPEWLGVPGGVAKEVYIFVAFVFSSFSNLPLPIQATNERRERQNGRTLPSIGGLTALAEHCMML
jgi:general L-amino acid transport system permease protein